MNHKCPQMPDGCLIEQWSSFGNKKDWFVDLGGDYAKISYCPWCGTQLGKKPTTGGKKEK
jgi:hypothetical protein